MIWPCHEYCLDVNKRFPRCAQVIWHVASRDMLALAGHSSTRCGHHKRALAILICCSEGLNQVHVFGSNRLGSSKKLLSSQNLQNLPHQLQSFVESFQATKKLIGCKSSKYRPAHRLIQKCYRINMYKGRLEWDATLKRWRQLTSHKNGGKENVAGKKGKNKRKTKRKQEINSK